MGVWLCIFIGGQSTLSLLCLCSIFCMFEFEPKVIAHPQEEDYGVDFFFTGPFFVFSNDFFFFS